MDTKVGITGVTSVTSTEDKAKRYIRTFVGDMEILKKGGVPDLAPIAPPHPIKKEEHVAAAAPTSSNYPAQNIIKEPLITVPSTGPIPLQVKIPIPPPAHVPPPPSVSRPLQTDYSDDLLLKAQKMKNLHLEDQSDQYVRTFVGDMETLKKGGVPDLVPFGHSHSEPKERLVAASPIEPIPFQVTLPTSTVTVRTPPPSSPAVLKTYESDFSQKMKDTHSSAATVLAAQQDSATGAPQADTQESSRGSLAFIFAGIVLLLAGGASAYFVYTRYVNKFQSVILAPSVTASIFVDDREKVSGTGLGLSQAINQSIVRPLAPGAVRLLYSAYSTTTPDGVFHALHMPVPDILLRNVVGADSMAGVVNVDGNQSPFFILSATSYSDTFAGMLQWEPAILNDFSQIFPPYISQSMSTTSVATSTKKLTSKATSTPIVSSVKLVFVDEVIANHDVRIYRDASGKSILLYGYWNQATLVIARDPAAFTEILQRLATSRSN